MVPRPYPGGLPEVITVTPLISLAKASLLMDDDDVAGILVVFLSISLNLRPPTT